MLVVEWIGLVIATALWIGLFGSMFLASLDNFFICYTLSDFMFACLLASIAFLAGGLAGFGLYNGFHHLIYQGAICGN